ncbi:cation:proton antiporter [Thiohalobacter sp. IOR34]|uniref:cation:proton antiporter domain-containing protein n=1 Tax=Thiohalobacter sp. IOR34 TaxID=3057176 RepID=UPI0025B060B4|nr:cation:proton antiporter [Thiohalobacter sp. IOR34]WJW76388.1 cation:proton antiporter [Thiohalobacter sp. IOR34]
MDDSLFEIMLIMLALGAAAVALCQRLHLSPVLGYLLVGMLAGPHALDWLPDSAETRFLAELGVVFLMFTIGLEFSLPRLLAARRLVVGLGGAEVVLGSVLFGLAAWLAGVPPAGALAVGGALAMSSTAIVLKQLGEQLELAAPHGRVAVAVLLFQDLAAVPFLVVLPALAGDPGELPGTLSLALGKAVLLFTGLVLFGRHMLRPVLHWVASSRSLELFMLVALLLALTAAGVSELAGLSPALGAFMAGMLLGETEFRHQVEADVRPFRDLLLGLFFVTIGMQLDLAAAAASWYWLVLLLGGFLVFKATLIALLARVFGEHGPDAWRSGWVLAQGGEFGLLLLSMAIGLDFVPQHLAQPILATMLLSMALAPVLLRFNGSLAAALAGGDGGGLPSDPMQQLVDAAAGLEAHVIICGYGRVGQNLARILDEQGIDSLALDLDPERVRQAYAAGEPVVFGDAGRPAVLEAAGIDQARAVAVTFDDAEAARRIAAHVRLIRKELPVLVRSVHDRDEPLLLASGAEVFPEGLEASLMFAGQLLILLGVPPAEVETRLNEIRAEDYSPLRAFYHDFDESLEAASDYPEQVRSLTLREHDQAVGRTPQELQLAADGVRLLDVRRGGLRLPGEQLDTRLRPGDVLVLAGSMEALERTLARLTHG